MPRTSLETPGGSDIAINNVTRLYHSRIIAQRCARGAAASVMSRIRRLNDGEEMISMCLAAMAEILIMSIFSGVSAAKAAQIKRVYQYYKLLRYYQ